MSHAEWDDERPLEDWEDPNDADDESPDEDTATRDCPHCGASVYEDAVQCPRCGDFLPRHGRAGPAALPWWMLAGLAAALAALLLMLFR